MTDTFDTCLAVVLEQEGGFVNNASDPGGATNLGITKATWEAWTGKPTSIDAMKALTPAQVAPLYAERFWNVLHCAQMPPALALCVFDFGVNGGPLRAAKMLQQVVGASQDGQIGAKTLAAVQQFATAHGLADLVRAFDQARRAYYRNLNTFSVFGRGWLARVDAVETAALGMAS